MIEKYHGLENALNYIQKFLETGDYSSFTRDYGISVSMIEKKITPQVLAKIIEIKKMNALKNASLDTLKKYDYSQLYIAL